ncbi:DNA-binding transcriptional regulator [Commensalibacter communis]|uniref:LysR family transcriptional regulator n=1 Tax=Commensalibacter communis TaxID=2972786 RepID=UPI0022FF9780|nr:LysR family transcriptional regulator [Commensalibacter communis]CAI3954633.1 DNA-binding transcriptional regulator [Commensalibacter communis]CAI3955371.1 DNA-binding transcriptional regulator [Commensalibacter communis]
MNIHPFSHKILNLYSRFFIYFQAILTYGSVRSAARHLRITPSALTRQIQNFELNIGVPLFERHAHGMVLTQAGDILSSHIMVVMEDLKRIENRILALHKIKDEKINIMVIESAANEIMPYVINKITTTYPTIRLQVNTGSSKEIFEALHAGYLDIGVALNLGEPQNLKNIISQPVKMDAIVHTKHALAGKKNITLSECVSYPLIMPSSSLSLYKTIYPLLKNLQENLNIRMESNSIDLMIKMAAAGMGLAFCSRLTTISTQEKENFIRIPIQNKETRTLLGVYIVKDKQQTYSVNIILQIIQNYLNHNFKSI